MMFPFRLGATSYILPADLVANAKFLAGKVGDIELVLFDLEDGQSNLPSPEVTAELARVAALTGMTFTVHLPLDLRLGDGGEEDHLSLLKARKVIDSTRALTPYAYVLHLDGRAVKNGVTAIQLAHWRRQSVRALEIVADWVGGLQWLAVENLEGYPLDFILPVFDGLPVVRCVDVGHLWLDGHDPLPYLQAALPRTRVIHIHGLGESDHSSLSHMPAEKLDPIVELLLCENYRGVLTLEVFGQDDFQSSVAALQGSVLRRRNVRSIDETVAEAPAH